MSIESVSSELTFTEKVIECIRAIPAGKISTYGAIAKMAGNPRAARQVVRVLHSCSKKERLPWQRVVNREGVISLPRLNGYEEQKRLLELEGVFFDERDRIDLDEFLWQPRRNFFEVD